MPTVGCLDMLNLSIAESTAMISSNPPSDQDFQALLKGCAATLQRVASWRLPAAVDARLLWLAENKEQLDDEQHRELLALSDFAEQRTLEIVQAEALLKQIAEMDPGLIDAGP